MQLLGCCMGLPKTLCLKQLAVFPVATLAALVVLAAMVACDSERVYVACMSVYRPGLSETGQVVLADKVHVCSIINHSRVQNGLPDW